MSESGGEYFDQENEQQIAEEAVEVAMVLFDSIPHLGNMDDPYIPEDSEN